MTARRRRKRIEKVVDGHSITTDTETSQRMAGIRQKDTKPELLVRKALTAVGLHYRVRNRDLPGSPDIANRRHKWAVFVHGCYWHRHPGCRRATTPKRNADFWAAKFRANTERDRRACFELEAAGFLVLIIWECEAERPKLLPKAVARFARDIVRR